MGCGKRTTNCLLRVLEYEQKRFGGDKISIWAILFEETSIELYLYVIH